jgi:hypothetical protein
MTISQERTVLTTTAAGRVEFATAGARRGAGCPWLVQGEIRRGDGVREELYIIAEPTEPTQRGGMGAKFIAAIRDVYAASTHDDPIVALTAAIEAANDALFHSNRSAAPGLRVVLGLTCLLVREHDLIICQVPPTQLLLAQNGAPVILPSFDSWRADYQPHESGDQQGLGATETATPLLFRAVLEEGDLIVLCSTNLARLLANDDDDHLGPLLGNDPREAAEFLRERAERNGLDPAYGMVIAPEPATSPAGSAPARGYDDDAEEGWDDAEDEAPQPRTGERWIDRSLREMREWSRVIPWRRRGGGRSGRRPTRRTNATRRRRPCGTRTSRTRQRCATTHRTVRRWSLTRSSTRMRAKRPTHTSLRRRTIPTTRMRRRSRVRRRTGEPRRASRDGRRHDHAAVSSRCSGR